MTDETKKTNNKGYIFAIGRRKEAVARVRLFAGKGETLVNGKPIAKYFSTEIQKSYYEKPFRLTKTESKYFATIKVDGSGKKGQLDAVVHGLSAALNLANKEEYRPILKSANLLTRDARVKERHKYGRAQKARKGKQSPKR